MQKLSAIFSLHKSTKGQHITYTVLCLSFLSFLYSFILQTDTAAPKPLNVDSLSVLSILFRCTARSASRLPAGLPTFQSSLPLLPPHNPLLPAEVSPSKNALPVKDFVSQ